MKRACIICDIDGVYVDSREWSNYIPTNSKDREGWDNFAEHVSVCKPNPVIIDTLKVLNHVFPIVFITSREDNRKLRNATIQQIEDFSSGSILIDGSSKNKLYMRNYNDFRKASDVKEEILVDKVLPQYVPMLAIDDDYGNITMFKKYGILTNHYKQLRN